MAMIRKGQIQRLDRNDVAAQISFIYQIFGITVWIQIRKGNFIPSFCFCDRTVVPGKGEVILVPVTVLMPERQKFNLNLRDFATSEAETGSVFTIDIPGEVIGRRGGTLEIKFLR